MNNIYKKYFIAIFFLLIFSTGLFFVLKKINSPVETLRRNVSVSDIDQESYESTTTKNTPENKPISENHFPENIEKKPIRFLFFGDIMLDRHIKDRYEKDYAALLGKIKETDADFFKHYDLVSANLEGAVIKTGAYYPPVFDNDFSFAPESLKIFQENNFNFFNIANNHLTDQGDIGVKETEENLDALGMSHSGSPDGKADSYAMNIVDIKGQRVGMLGFSMIYREIDKTLIKKILADAKTKSDFVVINIHWGKEYQHNASKAQIEMAHFLIDNGADMIIGHHPHVIQGIEKYQNKMIFYSLGNFIFDQYFSSDTQEGIGVGMDYIEGKMEYEILPFRSKLGIPEFSQREDREKVLKKIANWSIGDEEFKKEIEAGRVNGWNNN